MKIAYVPEHIHLQIFSSLLTYRYDIFGDVRTMYIPTYVYVPLRILASVFIIAAARTAAKNALSGQDEHVKMQEDKYINFEPTIVSAIIENPLVQVLSTYVRTYMY